MNIHDEMTIPGQGARHGEAPAWLADSPVWSAVKAQTGGGQLYLHQATGLELLGYGHNLVISTGTASGKSLVFQAPTLHHLATHPNATAIAIYPIKALARDQVMRWRDHGGGLRSGPRRHQPDRRRRARPDRAPADAAAHPLGPDDSRRDPAVADGLLGAPLRQAAAAPRPQGGAEHPVQRAPLPVQPGIPHPGRGPHL